MFPGFPAAPHPLLEPLELPADWADDPVPRHVDALLDDAGADLADLEDADSTGRFVASDYRWAWQILARWRRAGLLASGDAFLEWGCGQGVVTLLAALLGLQATGVDANPDLVAAARALARRQGISRARFLRASWPDPVPPVPGLPVVDAAPFRAVYAYPWPGEEDAFLRRFEATAAPGALLLLALGPLEALACRRRG